MTGRPLLQGHRARWVLAVVLGALASACAVALMAVSAWLISRAAQHPPVLYLMVAVVGVRAFGIGRGVLRYLERLVSHDVAFRLLARLRQRLVAGLADLAPTGLPLWRRGDLLSRLVSDVDDIGDRFLRVWLPVAGAAVVGAAAVLLLGSLLPTAGIGLAVALLVAAVLVPLLDDRRTARAERAVVRARSQRAERVGLLLEETTDLVLRGEYDDRIADLDRIERDAVGAQRASARSAGLSAGIAVLAMGGAVLVSVIAGTAAVTTGDLAPVLLAVLVLTPLALVETVQAVGTAAAAARRTAAAGDRVREVLEAGEAAAAELPTGDLPESRPDGPVIELAGVAARWPGADRDAVSGIDLVLRPGERVLVTGESGSGKSTLIAVLLGFLQITAGRMTVDGHDAADIDPEQWRTLFGWCEQQAHLFDTSVLENVRLARPTAGDDEVRRALDGAGLAGWIDGLPAGAATMVGEHGAAVSGGERQRLSVARALLADRPLLLADEPTAHLDRATADAVTGVLLDGGPRRAVLLVSHRPEDGELVDRVLHLDHGRMVHPVPTG
ncbi:thiol reductant ABC exporter subunit CydC [Nakamurella alba]|uniref:thiol reductant ABC exporter subunit CydC n=1 Tax=Nakamurella alba TaxID=2665158 RepID=UPI0012B9B282|nr:thiol reductant ABC exporter subunit CydC [Nakamurella alba]